MEMNPHSAPGYTPSGYLTPTSSAYEGRRDSIASMQSSASCANSFSSNSSAYYSNLPPTPHTSREVVGESDWMMVRPNDMSFDHGSAHTANDHDADEYNNHDHWPSAMDFGHGKPGRMGIQPERRQPGWVMVEPATPYTSAVRPTGSDNDTLGLPAPTDYQSFDSMPNGARTLLPAAELQSHSEMWPAHHPTTSALSLQGMTAEAYGAPPMNSGSLNMDYTWPQVGAGLEMPIFQDSVVHPGDTVHEADSRTYPEMNSDQSLEESFGSYDGYSSSTSQCSRYGGQLGDGHTSIKREADDAYLDHRSRSELISPQRRHRQKDRRIGPSGPSGITKRKHRCENRMDSFTANLDGCAVDFRFQADIQKDPKSGRYCSTAGETKKQRCRFEGCTKTFARPEHLKRHENTHSKERPFPCVVPGCGRRFSRNDNRKAHYETHLKEAMSGKKARNASVSFPELKNLLHSHEAPEEANKMIEKLQNPKVKVKHEKSDSR
ncbi:uncharacterized protein J3D65DRAFT_629466 [Phyllosticta citribraziliensis]|uniref:C2H2-type domain-containing protein n=5 Tax=Phyllosticta TaxID=121621 RepID=A0ABR1LJX3_9PEZI